MKKTFTTILSILYFVSGVGFSSTQYDCLNNQDMLPLHECQCCCSEELTESSVSNQLPEETNANSCCDEKDTSLSIKDSPKEIPSDCCIVEHNYNQLDISSLLPNIDVKQVTNISGESFNYTLQNPQNIDGKVKTIYSDLSPHIILPLLI